MKEIIKLKNLKISYEKLIKYFKKECGKRTRCFAYTGVDEYNSKQKKFLDMSEYPFFAGCGFVAFN